MSDVDRSADRPVHDRHGIIGGSSLSNLRTDSPWGCRRRLAYTFKGTPPSHERTYTAAMQLGHHFEDTLRQHFCKVHGVDCQEGPFIMHPELPFLGGHPDGLYGDDGIIEIKTANSNSFRHLGGDIYESYKDQLTLYMGITQRYEAWFVVGCSEDISLRFIRPFLWDQKRYDHIIEKCVNFVMECADGLPPMAGKRENGMVAACRRCEFRGLCEPPALKGVYDA